MLKYFLFTVFFVSIFVTGIPVNASNEVPELSELERVQKQLEKEHSEHEKLKKKTKDMSATVLKIRKEMVGVAKKVQEFEELLSDLEHQLSNLHKQKLDLLEKLERRDRQMVNILAALESLAWRPTEALVAQPTTPVDTVRSAILMRSTIPQIENSAEEIRLDLTTLKSLRAAVHSQHAKISIITNKMDNEHKYLHALFQKKFSMQKRFEKKTVQTEKRMKKLAKEADDLKDLLTKLENEKKERIQTAKKRAKEAQKQVEKARKAAERAKRLASQKAINMATEKAREVAERKARQAFENAEKADKKAQKHVEDLLSGKQIAAGSFEKAKGSLPFPARGKIIEKYGKITKAGIHAKGITLKTRIGAQVISPYDGVVLFSGPFRGYGQLLIIEHGDGYHTLLAGMTQIDSFVGQSLLAGEPVGRMETKGKPTLYVELRRDGQPINPLPWLVAENAKVNG